VNAHLLEWESATSVDSALRVVEGLTHGGHAEDAAVRAQVAFIRALVDEVARCPAIGDRVRALCAQLDDEVERLGRMARHRAPEPPRSGVQRHAGLDPKRGRE
jgi:hypothetical protein